MEEQKKTHPCPHEGCKATFNRPYRLTQHLLVHNNIKAFACNEPGCSKSYTNKSHLDRHINTVHRKIDSDVIYSCPACMKQYTNRQNLKRHIKIHHILKTPLRCNECNMEFRKKNQLHAHMYHHTGVKAFSCDLCSEAFVTNYEKKRHMRVHKQYNCDKCTLTFNQWSKYQKHKKTDHENDEYTCNECGRNFKQRIHIVRHIKIHTPKETQRIFPCPYKNCQRFYSRNSNLRQHILINHENIKHQCSMCEAQLSTKAKLNHHLQLHLKPDSERAKPKTLALGRKERKDKGTIKMSMAKKLAGLAQFDPRPEPTATTCNLADICEAYNIPTNYVSSES